MLYKTEDKNEEVYITDCYDVSKYVSLVEDIVNNCDDEEVSKFLIRAATRFIDINYSKVAQYYYNLEEGPIKELFRKLNLVIVDDIDAIESGYVKLSKKIIDNIDKYVRVKND